MKITKITKVTAGAISAVFSIVPLFAKESKNEVLILSNTLSSYNTNFESGPSNGGVDWWSDNSWSQKNVQKAQYKNGEALNADCGASYALVLSEDNNKAVAQICHANIAGIMQSGTEYTYTYYARLNDGCKSGGVSLIVKGFKKDWSASSVCQGIENPEVKLTDKWQKVTGTFVLEDVKDQVMIQFEGTEGTSFCIDDFRICPSIEAGTLEIQKDLKSVKSYMASSKGIGNGAIVGSEINTSEYVDQLYFDLTAKHFNAVTLGNELKPDCMNAYHNGNRNYIDLTTDTLNGETITVPVLDHSRADKILDKILEHNAQDKKNPLKVRGHVLVWHSQTPEWWFHKDYDASKEYVSKEEMNVRLEWYIKTMMDYYTNPSTPTGAKYGKLFYAWDVVNEACTDNGYRTDKENGPDSLSDSTHGNKSSWYHVYQSNEFIINAFRFANKYAPKSIELYYNDYGECSPKKRQAICSLLKAVKEAEGTRIDGMGMQAHYDMTSPTVNQFETAIRSYCAIVGKVMITEFDLKGVTDDTEGAWRYKELYDKACSLNKEKGITVAGITFWGTMDKYSWLQSSSSVGGGADGKMRQHPALFDDNYRAKNMYLAFTDSKKLPPKKEKVVVDKTPVNAINGTPVLGENIDELWNKAPSYELKLNNGAKTTGNVKLLWDDEYLYVLFTVKDGVLNTDNANAWEQDSIEVFIDETNCKKDEYTADDKQYRISCLNVHTFNGSECTEENVDSFVQLTKDGYVVQSRFKWTEAKPEAGKEVGIDFQINDADASGKRIGTVNLFDPTGNGWQWPSVFGSVILK